MPGQQGLPLRLETVLEGGRQQRWQLEESRSPGVLEKDGHYSWSSTLSLPVEQWSKAASVSCEASLNGQSPVTQTLDPDRCSE